MQSGISKEEALSLLRHAMVEPVGLLVYASEAQPFIQALYRAKREDPELQALQIRQTPEGIAICHTPRSYPSLPSLLSEESQEDFGTPKEDQNHDEEVSTGDS